MTSPKKFLIGYLVVAAGAFASYGYYVKTRPQRLERQLNIVQQDKRPGSWDARAALSLPLTEVGVAAVGDRVYVAGGFDAIGKTARNTFVYDPASDAWEELPPLPAGRHHAAVVGSGGLLFVLGGHTGPSFTPTDTLFIYDPATRVWTEGARMPEARGAAAAVATGSMIFLFGGVGPQGLSDATLAYDTATNSWSRKTNIPTARDHLAAAAVDGKIVVIGGRKKSLVRNLSAVEIYDPLADRWVEGRSMPTSRGGIAAAAIDGFIYVFGGESPRKTIDETEGYDVVRDQWTAYKSLPTARHGLGAAAIGDRVYVIGGGRLPGLSVSGSNEAFKP